MVMESRRKQDSKLLAAGWDRFGLTYDLDEPLATAVTPNSVAGYKRLSRC